jgi:hypothetical protein
MLIYRIQNDKDQGPYSPFSYLNLNKYIIPDELNYERSQYLPDGSERHQHPDADAGTPLEKAFINGLIKKDSPYIFGFASIEDLYIWYSPPEIAILELNGFFIYLINIPEEHVIFGSRQVIFNKNNILNKTKIKHTELRKLKI